MCALVPATELLIALWLRSLKPGACRRLMDSWEVMLSGTMMSANENFPDKYAAAREHAVGLIVGMCATCPKRCPRKLPAPPVPLMLGPGATG